MEGKGKTENECFSPKSKIIKLEEYENDGTQSEHQNYFKELKDDLIKSGQSLNEFTEKFNKLKAQLIDALEENMTNKIKIRKLTEENANLLQSYSNQQDEIENLKESLDYANNQLSQLVAVNMENEEKKYQQITATSSADCKIENAKSKYDAMKQAIMPNISEGKAFGKENIKISGRTFKPDCPFSNYVAIAEAHFHKMAINNPIRYGQKEIDSIDIVHNPTLEALFIAQREEFKENNIDCKEVLAFHGTSFANVDSILENNLNKISRTAYGHGYYFSEFPHVSLNYGDLLLFRVLPGNEWIDNSTSNIPPEYNSKKVLEKKQNSKRDAFGDVLVIPYNTQFLPYLVYNLK